MSRPDGSATEASSTSTCRPPNSSDDPADRDEAKNRISAIGNRRSISTRRITEPTWPVAPDQTDPHAAGPLSAHSRHRPVPPYTTACSSSLPSSKAS